MKFYNRIPVTNLIWAFRNWGNAMSSIGGY